jgi:D-alanyl-D-alanine carboxypeptidase
MPLSRDEFIRELPPLLDAETAKLPGSPGQLAAVQLDGEPVWTGAIGIRDRATQTPLNGSETVRLASLTKTFVAAAVLRLVEQDAIELDDPIASRAPSELIDPLVRDGYRVDRITIRQLLEHTSGIADYFDSENGSDNSAYGAEIRANPKRMWTAAEQVEFATEHFDPVSTPGAEYHYSDTGYVLLAAIVAQTTGDAYPAALRRLLRFDRLGLATMHVELLEPTPDHTVRAHQYIGDIDTYDVNPSYDLYGGGGLVGSMSDVAAFVDALFSGRVFDDSGTLEVMTKRSAVAPDGAGMGLVRLQLGSETCWHNSGALGLFFFTCPDIHLTMARSINQSQPGKPYDLGKSFEARTVELVRRLSKTGP